MFPKLKDSNFIGKPCMLCKRSFLNVLQLVFSHSLSKNLALTSYKQLTYSERIQLNP